MSSEFFCLSMNPLLIDQFSVSDFLRRNNLGFHFLPSHHPESELVMNENSVSLKPVKKVKSAFPISPTCPQPYFPKMSRGLRSSYLGRGSTGSLLLSSLSPIKTVILESDLTNYFLPLRESSIHKGGDDKQDLSLKK